MMSGKEPKIVKVVCNQNKRKIILPSTYKFLRIKLQQGFDFDEENIRLLIKEKYIEINEQNYEEKIKDLNTNDLIIVLNNEISNKLEEFIKHLQNFRKKRRLNIFEFFSFVQNLKPKKFITIDKEKKISLQITGNNNNNKNKNEITNQKLEERTSRFSTDRKTNLNLTKGTGKEIKNNNLHLFNRMGNVKKENEKVVPKLQMPQEHSINQEFLDKFINEMDELFKIKSKYDNSKLEEEKKKLKTKENLLAFFEKEDYITLNSYPKKNFQLDYKFVEVK